VIVDGKRVDGKDALDGAEVVEVGPGGKLRRAGIGIGGSGRNAPLVLPSGGVGPGGKLLPGKAPFAPPPRNFGDATLRGRVVDGAGAPLAGAVVWRIDADAPRAETTAISGKYMDDVGKTDAEGHFEITRQKAGAVLLMADYQGQMNVPGVGKETAHAVSVTANAGEVTDGIVLKVPLVLSDLAHVRGVVLDPEGKGVARAQVWLDTRLRVTSGADGRFDLGRVPPGRQTVRIEHVGLAPQDVELTLEPKSVRDLEVKMAYLDEGELRLAGTVLDGDGNAVAGVTIYLGAGRGTVREVVTDATGRFAFEKLPEALAQMDVDLSVWPRKGHYGTFVKDVALPDDALEIRVDRSFDLRVTLKSAGAGAAAVQQANYRLLVRGVKPGETEETWIARLTGGQFLPDGVIEEITVPAGRPARLWIEVPGHEVWEADLDTGVAGPSSTLEVTLVPTDE
jgi:hypothetical protein